MEQAFDDLKSQGCTRITRSWVDNHWPLVLWKRASIICCKPSLLTSWTFEAVCTELKYRSVTFYMTLSEYLVDQGPIDTSGN